MMRILIFCFFSFGYVKATLITYGIKSTVDVVAPWTQPILTAESEGKSPTRMIALPVYDHREGVLTAKIPQVENSSWTESEVPKFPFKENEDEWSRQQCKTVVEVTVVKLESDKGLCAQTGFLRTVGFYVRNKKHSSGMIKNMTKIKPGKTSINFKKYDWYEILNVCYDEDLMVPLYTVYTLHGESVEASEIMRLSPNLIEFEQDYLPPPENKDFFKHYGLNEQYGTFEKFFGQYAFVYNDKKGKILLRTPLAPPENMAWPQWHRATNTYVNVVPGFEAVVERNWRKLNEKIREYGKESQNEMEIVSFWIDQLQLPVISETDPIETWKTVKIFLDPADDDSVRSKSAVGKGDTQTGSTSRIRRISRIPVPLWFGLRVTERKTGKMIYFFVLNNPYENDCDNDGVLKMCSDSYCDPSTGWWDETWNQADMGCVQCCTAQSLFQERLVELRLPEPSVQVEIPQTGFPVLDYARNEPASSSSTAGDAQAGPSTSTYVGSAGD